MQQRVKSWLGYGIFALFCLVVSLYLTFPSAAVGQRLAQEVSAQTGGEYSLTFDDASPYGFSGIAVEGAKLTRSAPGGDMSITLDEARARVALLPLFLLQVVVNAGVELGDGSVQASFAPTEGGVSEMSFEISALDLQKPPVLPTVLGTPVGGVVSGEGALNTVPKEPKKAEGKLALSVQQASLGPGSISSFTLPFIRLGDVALALKVSEGNLVLESFSQSGGDLQLDMTLSGALASQLESSTVDGCLRIKATDEFLQREEKMRTVLQLAEVQLRKDSEGFLNVPFSGRLSAPRVRPRTLCRQGR